MSEFHTCIFTIQENKPVLQTDATIKGLDTCLLQDEKPVYFTSKALTETQKGYVTIEIESLAVQRLWRGYNTSCTQATYIRD